MKYDHKEIEKKWQEKWQQDAIFHVDDGKVEKEYLLVEFPYPSGDGLHAGHVRSYTAMDVVARKHRSEGKNVLYPIGWDAFGLPAENYAIKTGIHPKITTKTNIDNFRRQLKALGLSFDWSREINTTDPAYYKWTQWIFLQLYKNGLAYKTKTLINWCPKDKVTLANEEVVDGACERCGTLVEKREKEQWMLAITKYAQRLYDDLSDVAYIEAAKAGQRNWIGPSEGAEIEFSLVGQDAKIKVFTTRPDTLFGATYIVLAPEHPLVATLALRASNKEAVLSYITDAKNKSDIDRSAEGRDKTGIELIGVHAINPASKEEIPVYIADYVLGGYGTGAIMAVPAHDERDFEFAKKFNIKIVQVIEPVLTQTGDSSAFRADEPYTDSHAVIVLVKHWSEDKYLGLKWSEASDWGTLLTGGIDEGMSAEETALKEIREETGYKNMTIIKRLGTIHGKYFHVPKKANRIGHAPTFVVQLLDDSRDPVAEDESAKHELLWLTPEELKKFLTPLSHQTALSLHQTSLYSGYGILTNSGEFDGLQSDEAKEKITQAVGGSMKTTYKLRDWVFGRQRYWGEPIPMIHCEKCGWQAVKEEELPVLLPETDTFLPGADGESPLASMDEWRKVPCPSCKGEAMRETDVMPQWAGSSWYYLRYADPQNSSRFASEEALSYWTPVNWYNGGMEHTTLHLLYSRFWHKFLFDQKLVPTHEPYLKRTSHGLILAEDGSKMSKSKGNTVSPDGIIEDFGADALRLYEMFMGPFDQPVAWNTASISGVRRFLDKVASLADKVKDVTADPKTETVLHQTIKKVSEDIDALKMNTAVSTLMILVNHLSDLSEVPNSAYKTLIQLVAPFAPHLAHELWERPGYGTLLSKEKWPQFDASKITSGTVTVGVQVNGKLRGSVTIERDASEDEALSAARSEPLVGRWLKEGKEVKAVYVPGRIISFVVESEGS